jgi:hypothetical protein
MRFTRRAAEAVGRGAVAAWALEADASVGFENHVMKQTQAMAAGRDAWHRNDAIGSRQGDVPPNDRHQPPDRFIRQKSRK